MFLVRCNQMLFSNPVCSKGGEADASSEKGIWAQNCILEPVLHFIMCLWETEMEQGKTDSGPRIMHWSPGYSLSLLLNGINPFQ